MAQVVRGVVPCAILAALLFAVGCGGDSKAPPLAPAQGKVLLDGAPLAKAVVTFVGEKGQVATGMTGSDGVFHLTTGGKKGAPIGKCKVGITVGGGDETDPLAGLSGPEAAMEEYMKRAAKEMERRKDKRSEDKSADKSARLNAQYGNPDKSGLTADVAASGGNEFEFRLVE
jgi:hypothetical protein